MFDGARYALRAQQIKGLAEGRMLRSSALGGIMSPRQTSLASVLAAMAFSASMNAAAITITSSTFVQQGDINAALTPPPADTSVIGFAYAGNKFVGSV